MTPERFRAALTLLGHPHRQFAAWANVSDRRVRAWAAGTAEMPTLLADWLEGLTTYLEAHPMPKHRQDGTP
jgi:hypothetical protein